MDTAPSVITYIKNVILHLMRSRPKTARSQGSSIAMLILPVTAAMFVVAWRWRAAVGAIAGGALAGASGPFVFTASVRHVLDSPVAKVSVRWNEPAQS
jgi:hypothetical protein